ncbi:glycosyltransferase family 4 protein [Nocardioides ferulae]|uniref:glycosyltransferase family 4 protein n=1 Tax=Nocardioides ferulae TaxID=2340821 RepID=UPI000EB26049|nr:glycosyltransferase family 4 protein [Nocardioides ferulae]
MTTTSARPVAGATPGLALPRTVFLSHCAAWSGAEIALLRLLGPLAGARPLVVLAEDGHLVAELEAAGLEVRVLPLAARTNRLSREQTARLPLRGVLDVLRYAARLRRLLRQERVELVHANNLKSGVYGCLAARLAGVPAIWHVRDRIAPDYLPGPVVRLVRTLLLVLPDAVVANSASTLATLGPAVRRTVPHRVLGDPYRTPVPAGPRQAPATEPVVALVGRLTPWKGQHLFLDAVEELLADGVPVRGRLLGAALFGEDAHADEVAARLEAPPLAGRVTLGSFAGDAAHALADVDVVVNASLVPEPFGQVVVEAIANGVPVVVPDQGGPAEVVEPDVSGLTYRAGSAGDLAAALRRLLGDPDLHARLSRQGLARAADYDPQTVATGYAAWAGRVRRLPLRARLRRALGRG